MFKSYTHQRFFAEVSNREHREIFQMGNAPPIQPPVAPPTAPPVGPNVPPNNPNAARDAAKNRILKAQAAGQKVQTMKQSMDTAIADIKNLHTPPAGAPAAPDALTAAKSSVDAIKSATNINTLPADPLNTMIANARLLGPEAVIVCDKIDEAMAAADAAITSETDTTKKTDITAMKATLEANAKLVLADLLTPDVKTGAPKAAASFLGPLDPTVAKDIEAAANGETALLSAINDPNATEANRSKAIGQMMSKYGVTMEKNNAGNYAPVAPASSLVKFLNQVSGLFMMLGLGNFMQKKSASTPSGAPPNAPPNGPSTTLNQVEQDEIKKNIKDPNIKITGERNKATNAKTAAETELYGVAVTPNAPPPTPLPGSLKALLVTLNGEKTQLETDITNLKNATSPDPAKITAKTGELNVKISQITAKEAEIKAQEEIVKKEETKIKYMDDLKAAVDKNFAEINTLTTELLAFDNSQYANPDIWLIKDVFLHSISLDADTLTIKFNSTHVPTWNKFQDLATRLGIDRTALDLDPVPNVNIKSPEAFIAALKTMKEKISSRITDVSAKQAEFVQAGANPDDARDAAILNNDFALGITYENGTFNMKTPAYSQVLSAYKSRAKTDSITNLLAQHITTHLDLSKPENEQDIKTFLTAGNLDFLKDITVQQHLIDLAHQIPGKVRIEMDTKFKIDINFILTIDKTAAQGSALYQNGMTQNLKDFIDAQP